MSVAVGGMALAIACGAYREAEPGAAAGDAAVPSDVDAGGPGIAPDGALLTCTCLPEVPGGWEGPFLADELAACAAPWDTPRSDVHADLDAGVHLCTCTCSAAPPSCHVHSGNTVACGDTCNAGYDPSAFGGCYVYDDHTACTAYNRVTVDGGGPCLPNASQTISTPVWQRAVHRCEGAVTVGVCPNAANAPCVEKPSATGEICIAHAGDDPCPPTYASKYLYYTSYMDTRGCSPCGCGDAGAPCEIGVYGDAGCANNERVGTLGQACLIADSTASYAKLIRQGQACAAGGGAKVGTVEPSNPVTWCCRPPQ